jgi:hypothetical protein
MLESLNNSKSMTHKTINTEYIIRWFIIEVKVLAL